MSGRYPDLGEPVNTTIGSFKVVHLNTGEFVECCYCFAIVRKERAKGHAAAHDQVNDRLFNLKKAFGLAFVAVHPAVDWLDAVWSPKSKAPNTGRQRS